MTPPAGCVRGDCEVPGIESVTLRPVPRPRHVWSDTVVCPHADASGEPCPVAFLVVQP